MSLRSAYRLVPVILAAMYLSGCARNRSPSGGYTLAASTEIGPACEHLDDPYSEWMCISLETSSQFRPMDVVAETLVVHTTDGRNIRVALARRTDALFLSKSALETFLLRHYDATDAAKARVLRRYIDSTYHH